MTSSYALITDINGVYVTGFVTLGSVSSSRFSNGIAINPVHTCPVIMGFLDFSVPIDCVCSIGSFSFPL